MRISKLIGAGVGFLAGSVVAGFIYGILPSDITASISLDQFKLLTEIAGAYLGYAEG